MVYLWLIIYCLAIILVIHFFVFYKNASKVAFWGQLAHFMKYSCRLCCNYKAVPAPHIYITENTGVTLQDSTSIAFCFCVLLKIVHSSLDCHISSVFLETLR